MNAELAIYLVQALNLFAFATVAIWFVVPRLRLMTRANALTALVSVHLGPDIVPAGLLISGRRIEDAECLAR